MDSTEEKGPLFSSFPFLSINILVKTANATPQDMEKGEAPFILLLAEKILWNTPMWSAEC